VKIGNRKCPSCSVRVKVDGLMHTQTALGKKSNRLWDVFIETLATFIE